MIHFSSSFSFNNPSSFSISFNKTWNTSDTFSPVLDEHSRKGTPQLLARFCACSVVTSRSSAKSFILPIRTRGTSGASPRAFSKASLIFITFSKEEREVMEKTRAYPWTPTLAFRDKEEYSSFFVNWIWATQVIVSLLFQDDLTHTCRKRSFTHHTRRINYVSSKMYFSKTYRLVMCIFNRWIIVLWKCPTNECVCQRRLPHCSKPQDCNLSMY